MIVDARALPDGHLIDVDLCIVGSGPAGLTVARELRDPSLSICIVESGSERLEQSYERLNESIVVDSDLTPPEDARARAVGGSSHHWNLYSGGFGGRVRLLPFSTIDFEERSWVPDSGWPITFEELEPFQRRARSIAGLTATAPAAGEVSSPSRPILPLDRDHVRTAVEWFGEPARFRRQIPRELAQRPNITLLTNATATSIKSDATTTAVSGLQLQTLAGGHLSVRATRIVLATGGIENARLLLASRDRHPNGLGNNRDVVGRYFMDHLKLMVADFTPTSPSLVNRMGFYDIHRVGQAVLTGKLQLADQVQRQARLLNAAVRLEPSLFDPTAALAWRRVASGVKHGRLTRQTLAAAAREVSALPRLARLGAELAFRRRSLVPSLTAGWSRLRRPSSHYERFALELQLELAPRPENRVFLSDRRDALGQPVPAISWRWGELERRTCRETVEQLAIEFRRGGLGEIKLRNDEDFLLMTPAGDNHPTGTTRMHSDPARGVVDTNCRVHGIGNLYIAGSSVFPTSGYANPTLTVIAMAARLADHLKPPG